MVDPPRPAKPRVPADLEPWFEARRRFRFSHSAVQMARELGLNPTKLGKLSNVEAEPWKEPLFQFIARCYRSTYKRDEPLEVRTLEQVVLDRQAKKAAEKERKAQRRLEGSMGAPPDEA